MMNSPLGSRAAMGYVLGASRVASQSKWFLAGGVNAANCIAAYTPKGAVSLAASYDNNAAPGNGLADGTYDAAPGVAPTFAAATGWTFNNAEYLESGVIPSSGWSLIVRISGAATTTNRTIGTYVNGTSAFAIISSTGAQTYYYIGNGAGVTPYTTDGVLAIAGTKAYKNGSDQGIALSGTFSVSGNVRIGAIYGVGTPYFTGNILAVAIYNVTLDAATVAAISAAMAAL